MIGHNELAIKTELASREASNLTFNVGAEEDQFKDLKIVTNSTSEAVAEYGDNVEMNTAFEKAYSAALADNKTKLEALAAGEAAALKVLQQQIVDRSSWEETYTNAETLGDKTTAIFSLIGKEIQGIGADGASVWDGFLAATGKISPAAMEEFVLIQKAYQDVKDALAAGIDVKLVTKNFIDEMKNVIPPTTEPVPVAAKLTLAPWAGVEDIKYALAHPEQYDITGLTLPVTPTVDTTRFGSSITDDMGQVAQDHPYILKIDESNAISRLAMELPIELDSIAKNSPLFIKIDDVAAISKLLRDLPATWTVHILFDYGGLSLPGADITPKQEPGGGQATGGDYMVTQPTLFLAGEAGPERATFTPYGQVEPAGNATTTIYQNFYGPTSREDARDGVLEGLRAMGLA